MDSKLEGKVCLLTGGTQGIGKSIAKALAKEGVNLSIVSRNKNESGGLSGKPLFKKSTETLIRANKMSKVHKNKIYSFKILFKIIIISSIDISSSLLKSAIIF